MKKGIFGFIILASIAASPLALAQYHTAAMSTKGDIKAHSQKASDDKMFDDLEAHHTKLQKEKQQKEDADVFALVSAEQEKQKAEGGFNPEDVDDRFEGYNRAIFDANDQLDKAIAEPIAKAYAAAMPNVIQTGVNNFFVNIDNLPIVINDVLQARFYQATADAWRMLINSTIGLLGLFDIAKHTGLEQSYNDFGLTLASWGWTNSTYFMIPILGPSTIRDALGRFINFFSLSVYTLVIRDFYTRWGLYGVSLLNSRVQLLKTQDFFNRAAIDPYVFMRDAYLQHRAYLIELNSKKRNPYTPMQTRAFNNPMYLYGNN